MLNNSELRNKVLYSLGYGDPEGGIWFVGIREGLGHEPDDFKAESPRWGEVSRHDPEPAKSKTLIWLIESVLASSVSENHPRCVYYEENCLWQPGSHTCHLNLFPLGQHDKRKSEEEYVRSFGFQSSKDYYESVRKIRFQLIRDEVQLRKPKAIVCFGRKSYKDDFKLAFIPLEWNSSSDSRERLLLFEKVPCGDAKTNVLIMNHFSNGHIKHYDRIEAVKLLQKWQIRLP